MGEEPHPPAYTLAIVAKIVAEHHRFAGHDGDETRADTQQGGLAGTVRAVQQDDLPAADIEIDACKRREAAKEGDRGTEVDDGLHDDPPEGTGGGDDRPRWWDDPAADDAGSFVRVRRVSVARILGFTGRMMIRAGVLILLFVAFQLWGTGLHTSRAQDDLEKQFRTKQDELGERSSESSDTTTSSATASTASTAPPVTASPDFPTPKPGEPIGLISIPDIGADFFFVEGVDLRWLRDGPGHFPQTPLPGQPGNAALAGHRTTFKAPFNRLDELDPGDLIFVETLQGRFTYEVMPQPAGEGEPPKGHYIVGPRQTEILDDKGDNRLTLMACHPKYSAAQRIVVEAKLVSNPAPATPLPPTTDVVELPADDLAGGRDAARVPAALWSLGAVAVWFLAWFAGRRRPGWRWPAYAVGLPLFALALFEAFDHINQLLPGAY